MTAHIKQYCIFQDETLETLDVGDVSRYAIEAAIEVIEAAIKCKAYINNTYGLCSVPNTTIIKLNLLTVK